MNETYTTEAGRRFARTTLACAQDLLRGARESLRTGNEGAFTQAYLIYAGVRPNNMAQNTGGERADELSRALRSISNAQEVNVVPQRVLTNLGGKLNTSPNFTSATIMLHSNPVRFAIPPGLTYNYFGSIVGNMSVSNPTDNALRFSFSYIRPTSITVSSNIPFAHAQINAPDQAETTMLFLPQGLAGAFTITVRPQSVLHLEFTSETPRQMDTAIDFEVASAGYHRAKNNELLSGHLNNSLDEFMTNVMWNAPYSDLVLSIFCMLCQAYELTHRALSIRTR